MVNSTRSDARSYRTSSAKQTKQSFVCLMVTYVRNVHRGDYTKWDRKSSSGCISPPPTGIILLFWCSPRLVSQRQSLLFDRSFVSASALPPVHSHKLRPHFATSLIDSELAQCAGVTKAAQNIDACSMRSPVVVVVVGLLNGDCGVFKMWALLHFVFSA